MEVEMETAGEKATVATGVATAVGALLPWVSAGFVSFSGIDGDGVFTLLFGIAAVAVVLFREWERLEQVAVGVFGVLTVLIAGLTYANLAQQSGIITAVAGVGLHLTLLGGIGLIAGAVADRALD